MDGGWDVTVNMCTSGKSPSTTSANQESRERRKCNRAERGERKGEEEGSDTGEGRGD